MAFVNNNYYIICALSLLMCVICAVFSQDIISDEDNASGTNREIRGYNQDWRTVDHYQQSDSQEWIPQDERSPENIPTEQSKRRRLRKRKRRPPMRIGYRTDDENDESASTEQRPVQQRKRIRPQRLDQLNEPSWQEMSDETPQRPYIRRRITPIYQQNESSEDYEKIRDPFTALEEAELKQKTNTEELLLPQTTTEKPDLKSLLKQTGAGGTLSLSEILQKKNLSLSELLMGNRKAISALTEKPLDIAVTEFQQADITKYKRLPPSVGLRKYIINRNDDKGDESPDILTSRETLEAQRKRLTILHGHKENKIYSDLKKFEVLNEPTTEKRVFIPSRPKYYDHTKFDEDISELEENGSNDNEYDEETDRITTSTTTSTTTTTTITPLHVKTTEFKRISFKPKVSKNSLPVTSAKLNRLSSTKSPKVEEEPNYPKFSPTEEPNYPKISPKPIKIDVSELFSGLPKFPTKNNHVDDDDDEPFKMTIDLHNTIKTTTTRLANNPINIFENKLLKTTSWEITTPSPMGEKLKYVTAKEEIMEILNDPLTRYNLSRILQFRNMTVDQLVEQRERGSSQLHLADIFHNKTKEPEPKEEPFVGQINSDYFNNYPIFNRQGKSRSFSSPPTTRSKSEIKPLPMIIETATEKDKSINSLYTVTSFPTYKIEMNKTQQNKTTTQNPLPIWKQLYPDLFPKLYENAPTGNEGIRIPEIKITSIGDIDNSLDRSDEIENKLLESTNDQFNVDLENQENYDEEDFITLPSGVKSAIIASSAIIGLSLLVFLTILVIFKLSQKHKQQRLSYSSSFSGSKIKKPILESAQRRSLRTFMNETLGRKKNYYKSHMQSMSDSIWDSERKPYI